MATTCNIELVSHLPTLNMGLKARAVAYSSNNKLTAVIESGSIYSLSSYKQGNTVRV